MRNGDFYRATRMLRVYQTGMKAACLSLSLSLFFPLLPPFFPFPFSFSVGPRSASDRIPIGGRAFAIRVSRDLCNIGQRVSFASLSLSFALRGSPSYFRCRCFHCACRKLHLSAKTCQNVFFFCERERMYVRIPNLDTS